MPCLFSLSLRVTCCGWREGSEENEGRVWYRGGSCWHPRALGGRGRVQPLSTAFPGPQRKLIVYWWEMRTLDHCCSLEQCPASVILCGEAKAESFLALGPIRGLGYWLLPLSPECPHGNGGCPDDGLYCGDDQHWEGGGQCQAILYIQRLKRTSVWPRGCHGILDQ